MAQDAGSAFAVFPDGVAPRDQRTAQISKGGCRDGGDGGDER